MKKIFSHPISKIYKNLTKLSNGKNINSFPPKKETQAGQFLKENICMANRLIKSINNQIKMTRF